MTKVDDCVGDEVAKAVAFMLNGFVCLFENMCFYKEEEKNDFDFVKKFVGSVMIFVNDAFGIAYRAYVFIEGVIKYCKMNVVGFLF